MSIAPTAALRATGGREACSRTRASHSVPLHCSRCAQELAAEAGGAAPALNKDTLERALLSKLSTEAAGLAEPPFAYLLGRVWRWRPVRPSAARPPPLAEPLVFRPRLGVQAI